MTDQELQNTLYAIAKHLEETMQYVAAIEAALVKHGKPAEGDVEPCLADQRKHLAGVRSLISRLHF